jgi:hypothetical protein
LSRSEALAVLAACLRGEPPAEVDWDRIIPLANESLTIAALAAATRDIPELPADVSVFFAEILRRNAMRNRRLIEQLNEASTILNAEGILPVVKKGAAMLLSDAGSMEDRMVSDLDLIVPPVEMTRARIALQRIGYGEAGGGGPAEAGILSRNRDVGMIDLHCRPRGPARFSGDSIFSRHSRQVRVAGGGGFIILPSPTLQILYLTLHDQFHDGDYWRGYVDLRHMIDTARLAALPEGVDWDALRAVFSTRYACRAFIAQITNASRLMGMALPVEFGASRLADLQYRRWLIQADRPWLAALLSLATILLERPPRKHESVRDRSAGTKVGRARLHFQNLVRARAHGKI